MAQKHVNKFIDLGDGFMGGKLTGHIDPRGYQPPKGYFAYAAIINKHPLDPDKKFNEAQWWLFLKPRTINHVITSVYLEEITHIGAIEQLAKFPSTVLAERLLDCFHRGDCRGLFCSEDGEPHEKGNAC
jgi:hypothetical protein